MGERVKDSRLQELYDSGANVYSISKINTVSECLYEAGKTYLQHDRGKNGIYGFMGTKIHDTLELIMNNEADESALLPAMESELDDLTLLDIDFPKDFKGGTGIRDSWVADMKHFCCNFSKPKGRFTTEELVLYQLKENRWVQGYIDLIKYNSDGSISIYDWKTSSQFTKEDLLHHGRQLVFYAIAKENEGFLVKEVAWIMLKYVEVSFMGKAKSNSKNETLITKVINRGKLISELQPYIEYDLKKLGLSELDIEIMINDAKVSNSLNMLPKDILNKYIVKPYVRKYEITDDIKQETIDYINEKADIFESMSDDENSWEHRKFTKTNGKGEEKDDTFFCNILCNHRETCKHIKRYNETKLIMKSNDEDLF